MSNFFAGSSVANISWSWRRNEELEMASDKRFFRSLGAVIGAT
jgi:hypothetical protein